MLLTRFVFRNPTLHDLYTRWKFGTPKGQPRPGSRCAVLQSEQEWRDAQDEVIGLGLPIYETFPPKNWDTLIALRVLLENTQPTSRVLDAGGERYSTILPSLARYGYKKLTAMNLSFERTEWYRGVMYRPGDIVRSAFAAATFDAVTCLSVVEHGVPIDPFLAEMERIIKPGGILVLSTDYFETPTETHGRTAYGQPIHIFDRREIESLIAIARSRGFELIDDVDLRSSGKPVAWTAYDLEYTFVALSFQRSRTRA